MINDKYDLNIIKEETTGTQLLDTIVHIYFISLGASILFKLINKIIDKKDSYILNYNYYKIFKSIDKIAYLGLENIGGKLKTEIKKMNLDCENNLIKFTNDINDDENLKKNLANKALNASYKCLLKNIIFINVYLFEVYLNIIIKNNSKLNITYYREIYNYDKIDNDNFLDIITDILEYSDNILKTIYKDDEYERNKTENEINRLCLKIYKEKINTILILILILVITIIILIKKNAKTMKTINKTINNEDKIMVRHMLDNKNKEIKKIKRLKINKNYKKLKDTIINLSDLRRSRTATIKSNGG